MIREDQLGGTRPKLVGFSTPCAPEADGHNFSRTRRTRTKNNSDENHLPTSLCSASMHQSGLHLFRLNGKPPEFVHGSLNRGLSRNRRTGGWSLVNDRHTY
nr:PREDICTED: uncharacterized protein LOC105662413 [Megachile rotundata]